MATFKYYNLQVLPLDGKEENLIGSDGYKKIFSSYNSYYISPVFVSLC